MQACAEAISQNIIWHTPSGEDKTTKAERYTRGRRESEIPKPRIPEGFDWLVENFYNMRGFAKSIEEPLSPSDIKHWSELNNKSLPKWEVEAYFVLDRALRSAHNEVIMVGMDRDRAAAKRKADKKNGGRSTNL